ncbi:MAG: squalene synthase HpnC [Dehalococcoidia bacterium]|nr:squalene synthase HpnC [Dehalococcoidia bacterium]MCA9828964.1 squalene synthase HpnC [Dehalococcoidia bacterium]MCB9486830.1 squalene synthase HpnC [Thermoflexaceae bacterium]
MALATEAAATRKARLRDAYSWCRDYARAHQENFTVVSWVLPRELRPHFWSLYSFCRWTDDLGDEAKGDRLALLNDWERSLIRCYEGIRDEPLFVALGRTIDRFRIPPDPFLKLIEANRRDQEITRFPTFDALLDYCSYSATPVGRMVLYVLGYRDEERQRLSDETCIGLQLANFWQDVSVDWTKGRVYLPQEDLARFGVAEADIAAGVATGPSRRLLEFEVRRTQGYFDRGRALERLVSRKARADVRLFRLGGEAVLKAIRAHEFDVLSQRPTIAKQRKAWMGLESAFRVKLGF